MNKYDLILIINILHNLKIEEMATLTIGHKEFIKKIRQKAGII